MIKVITHGHAFYHVICCYQHASPWWLTPRIATTRMGVFPLVRHERHGNRRSSGDATHQQENLHPPHRDNRHDDGGRNETVLVLGYHCPVIHNFAHITQKNTNQSEQTRNCTLCPEPTWLPPGEAMLDWRIQGRFMKHRLDLIGSDTRRNVTWIKDATSQTTLRHDDNSWRRFGVGHTCTLHKVLLSELLDTSQLL